MNPLIGALLSTWRRFAAWVQSHRHIRPVFVVLSRHWAETLAVICLVALVLAVNPPKLAGAFSHAKGMVVLLMVPVVIGTYVVRGIAWWFTLRCIGVKVTVRRALTVEFAGQVMVFLPLGDLARVAMLRATTDATGPGPITGTIAFQELVFMMMLGLGVLPRVVTNPGVALLVVLMLVVHGVVFTVLSWQPAYRRARLFVERIRVLRRFDKQLRELRPAFMELWDPRAAVPVFVLQAIAAMLSFLLFYLALQAMGVTTISFITATFVMSLSYLLAGLSLIPGGLGAFEGLLTILLISNGVPAASAAAAGLLYRAFNDVFVGVMGAPFALRVRRLAKRREPPRGTRGRRSSARAQA
ncbi:MAG: YbhN family protein [Candidatus Dormibacteria bacterium]